MQITDERPCVWSEEQEEIFAEFAYGTGNLVVVARAGVGKTTTAIEGIQRAPEAKILMSAFSKRTELDLTKKLQKAGNPRAEAKTSHALGFSIVRKYLNNLKVDNADRADALTLAVCGKTPDPTILRLVKKLHTQGRENAPHATKYGELTALAIRFDCQTDEWSRCQVCGKQRIDHLDPDAHAYQGYDNRYIEEKALEAMELASQVQDGGSIDYADMIFLPVRNHWMYPQYDLVVIDEAQDLTVTQLEIMQGVCKGRIIVIGDNFQAIYGFRGADSESLDRLKAELHAKELKLTTTYRCGLAIVREAQAYVPDFQVGPENPEGEVWYLDKSRLVQDAGPGNFILSRTNAPLVPIAIQLLRAGKRTQIAGVDIGAGLKTLIRKFKARSIPDLLSRIKGWQDRETVRVKAQMVGATNGKKAALQAKIDGITDQAGMLTDLTDGAKSVDDLLERVDFLFTDDGLGDAGIITCSSVHKAKGLEADKVYILADTLRHFNQEEDNICYVAITRAKKTLVYVTDPQAK